jgi:hypothetical protein
VIIGNAASLAADPSAKNFTAVVANMLGSLTIRQPLLKPNKKRGCSPVLTKKR